MKGYYITIVAAAITNRKILLIILLLLMLKPKLQLQCLITEEVSCQSFSVRQNNHLDWSLNLISYLAKWQLISMFISVEVAVLTHRSTSISSKKMKMYQTLPDMRGFWMISVVREWTQRAESCLLHRMTCISIPYKRIITLQRLLWTTYHRPVRESFNRFLMNC